MYEIWKDIEGYEGLYQVSTFGNIKSLPKRKGFLFTKERILKPKLTIKGYLEVTLRKNNYSNYKRINRLVAEAFIPNPENKPEVNHKDGNKQNNNDWNLEWNTNQENKSHAVKNKLNSFGEKCYLSKLTEEDVLKLRSLKGKMKTKDLAYKFKITRLTVYRILNNKLWKQLT
jgi:hypothetical protein